MYGPVRTVVWEGRSREAPPYPDCALFAMDCMPMQLLHRPSFRETCDRVYDSIRVNAMMAIKVLQSAGLTEMFDAQRARAVAADTAEP